MCHRICSSRDISALSRRDNISDALGREPGATIESPWYPLAASLFGPMAVRAQTETPQHHNGAQS